jgi:hypothetical protein
LIAAGTLAAAAPLADAVGLLPVVTVELLPPDDDEPQPARTVATAAAAATGARRDRERSDTGPPRSMVSGQIVTRACYRRLKVLCEDRRA